MNRTAKTHWILLGILALCLAPATCWAHGDLQGLAAVFVAVFLGGAMAVVLLPCTIVLIVLLAKRKHTRGARIFARVVQSLAIPCQLLYVLITFLIEHNQAGLIVGSIASALLLAFTGSAFVLAQVLARRCLRAERAGAPAPPARAGLS